ncbi:NAD(P)/FAD-dependent oxidoreductase [Vibrio tetraodonis]|uniref:NAD(P)/FAD-dependent oxidoreductase n=1 Tax=Vibrio tetraodonis TaxID=2231647 RepID=UPI000E0CA28D|nr:NAD(P)/FAD-dependent oxidoreductase [Vibrio tetraodonis]
MQNSLFKDSNNRHIAILGAGFSGLVIAHECIKRGFTVSIYDKESYPGGKCVGTAKDGIVHEVTHRQFFAKNRNLIELLKEIPSPKGTCFNSLYPQNKVQFHWAKKPKTMQFQRAYFSTIEKLVDDAKSAYAMHYANVPLKDIVWFKKQLTSDKSQEELLKTPVSQYFEYQSRVKLSEFLRPVLVGWIGATDSTPALSVLDLLNNKIGELHPEAPGAYSLGIDEPITDAIITPFAEYLKLQGARFHFNSELAQLSTNETGTLLDHASLTNGHNIKADIFVSALPAHVMHNLLGEHCSHFDYDYVFSHGFQFHFSAMPEQLKSKTVGIVIDSPWGLSYNITRRQVAQGECICLSVTATNISCAKGSKYQRPLIDCNQSQIKEELLIQIFGDTELLSSTDYQGFHPGPGAKIVTPEELSTVYSSWFKGDVLRDEKGDAKHWVFQHALTQPTTRNSQGLTANKCKNLFFTGEYLFDPKQHWRVPVTLERCVETARLCCELIVEREKAA